MTLESEYICQLLMCIELFSDSSVMISCEIERRSKTPPYAVTHPLYMDSLHGFSTADKPPDMAAVASRTEQPRLGGGEAVPPSHGHT